MWPARREGALCCETAGVDCTKLLISSLVAVGAARALPVQEAPTRMHEESPARGGAGLAGADLEPSSQRADRQTMKPATFWQAPVLTDAWVRFEAAGGRVEGKR